MSKAENQKPLWAACVCLPVVDIRFPQDCFYPPPQQISMFLSPPVNFLDCGRGGPVRMECSNPSDFRIEADGVVYAARSIQHSPQQAVPLLIRAIDGTTQQQWMTQVRLEPPALSSQQVSAQSSLHSTRRDDRIRSPASTAESFHKLYQVFREIGWMLAN